jgi:hypothetical protein
MRAGGRGSRQHCGAERAERQHAPAHPTRKPLLASKEAQGHGHIRLHIFAAFVRLMQACEALNEDLLTVMEGKKPGFLLNARSTQRLGDTR